MNINEVNLIPDTPEKKKVSVLDRWAAIHEKHLNENGKKIPEPFEPEKPKMSGKEEKEAQKRN
jgi:hypothetical protein